MRSVLGCQKVPRKVHQGSAKVAPRISKFRGVSGSLGQIRLGLAKGSAESSAKVPPRFHRGSTKVSRRLRKFRDHSGFLGASAHPFRFRKGSAEGSPITSFHLSPSSFNSLSHFSPVVLVLGSSAILKVLGQNDTFVFWGSLQQMAFASQKVLWSPKLTDLYIGLRVSRKFCAGFPQLFSTFVSQMAVASLKNSLEGSANCALHLSPTLLLGSNLREVLTCLNHTNPDRRNRPIVSLLLGYSLGLFVYMFLRPRE